jgi:hypothetical protein
VPQHSANLRLIGYEKFTISALFLRALEDEIRVSQWGPKRNPKIAVHRCLGIRTGNQLRTEIEQPCSVSLISGHAGQDGNGTLWIGKDSKGKVRLNLQILGQIGAASAVILDACSAPVMLPELARHARPGAVLIGLAADDTDGRNSVTVLGDVLRELCYPRRPGLGPSAVVAAAERVNARIDARNRLALATDQTPNLIIHQA